MGDRSANFSQFIRGYRTGESGLAVVLTTLLWIAATPAFLHAQGQSRLSLDQVEQLIRVGAPDSAIAGEIHRRGVDFVPSKDTLETLRHLGAGPQTLQAVDELTPILSPTHTEDLIYIPSYQGAGLIEIRPAEPTARRIAKTTGFNNSLVLYNPRKNEFYVGLENGDHVAIVNGESFTQTGKLSDSVGWNTSSLELSHDGKRLVVAVKSAVADAELLVFSIEARSLAGFVKIPNGSYPTYAVFSPDDRTLYVSSGDSIFVYDSGDLELRQRRSLSGWQASPMVISPDGTALFLLQNRTLVRWSTQSLDVAGSTLLPEPTIDSYHSHLQISRDGSAVWVGGRSAIYRVRLALDRYTIVRPPENATDRQYQFAESSDGRYLYVLTGNDARANLLILDVQTSAVAGKIADVPYPTMVLVR